jgi:hypothetical protein
VLDPFERLFENLKKNLGRSSLAEIAENTGGWKGT